MKSNSTPTKELSSKQETMIAKYLDWNVVSGSGARSFHPGDIVSDDYLGECKTHMTKQSKIVFYRDFWDKIKNEAMSQFKTPVLFVDNGTQTIEFTYCVLPYSAIPFEFNSYKCLEAPYVCNHNITLGITAKSINVEDNLIYKVNWKGEFVALLNLQLFKSIVNNDID